jgi:AbrB family looped-hinge helix DNA binding protein
MATAARKKDQSTERSPAPNILKPKKRPASGMVKMTLSSKMTSKGQITVPHQIRQHLQIAKGDRIEFMIGSEGKVTLLPATTDIKALKGMVAKPQKRVTIEDMRQVIKTEGGRKA